MKTQLVWTMILVSLLCVAAGAGAGEFFPLGVWYEGGVGEFRNNLIPDDPAQAAAAYARDFADIGAHGVNAAVVPNTQLNHFKPLLDAAQAGRVKLIIELGREGGDLGQMVRGSAPLTDEALRNTLDTNLKPVLDHPALWGVQLLDEPQGGTFERYAKISNTLKAYAPKRPSFTCLIGPGELERFAKTVKPVAAAFDCYPLGGASLIGGVERMAAYEQAANAAGKAGVRAETPIWAVIQAHSCGADLRPPTPAELRCMTYLALASGCKGVWWFLYQTECSKQGAVEMAGLVDPSFKGNERWEEVGRLTRAISKLIPTLKGLTLADDAPLTSNATAHLLKDRGGKAYVFAVNADTLITRTITLRLDASVTQSKEPRVTRVDTGDNLRPQTADGKIAWSERLPPGAGALYAIE